MHFYNWNLDPGSQTLLSQSWRFLGSFFDLISSVSFIDVADDFIHVSSEDDFKESQIASFLWPGSSEGRVYLSPYA